MIQTQGPSSSMLDGGAALRESAFRVFSGCPNLVMDLQTDAVLGVLGRGLQDQYSIEVKLCYIPVQFDSLGLIVDG